MEKLINKHFFCYLSLSLKRRMKTNKCSDVRLNKQHDHTFLNNVLQWLWHTRLKTSDVLAILMITTTQPAAFFLLYAAESDWIRTEKSVMSLIPILTLFSMIFHIQVLWLLKYSRKQPGCQYYAFARFNPNRTCRNNVESELVGAQWNHWE